MANFFEAVQKANGAVNSIVWGPYMLVLLVGTGIYLTVRSGFLQVFHIGIWWQATLGTLLEKKEKHDDANISPFQAVTAAMASTVGIGNIVGAATAITLGGPGAVFWMWVSGFFGMMTKYSEIVLAVKYRETDANGAYHGGPMYYIQNGLNMKWLAILFAVFGMLASFGIGNMTQANAVADSVESSFGIPKLVTGIIISIFCGLVIIGGIKRIAKVTVRLVPLMAIFYFLGSIIVIATNIDKLPSAFGAIFSGAFSFESIGGGIMGYSIMRAMRYGIARGVFSNEAGLGSAPIAHAATREKDPVRQGMWGIFEVFIDTMVICTISALVVLIAGLYDGGISGAPLVQASFVQSFGSFGGIFVTIAILCFAGSTMLGWSYYGQQCLGYLSNKNKTAEMIYKMVFTLMVIVGAMGGLTFVWDVADTLNGLMAVPNLIALLLLSKVIISLTKEHLSRRAIID
ncbi:MAG: sodium:alanine symporter family protein [Treponema sp.]|nr:sodium:alanine symporter family protein [Treponema sp.]